MSQAGVINLAAGPVPPAVPTQFTEDTGIAVPVGNNLNVFGGSGVSTSGSGSTVTISIKNSVTSNVTTIGAVTADLITIPLGAVPKSFTFDVRVSAHEAIAPAGAGYQVFGTARTDGVTATLIGAFSDLFNEDPSFINADANLVVSGNNAIIRVLGVAGLTISWGGFAVYVTSS